MNAMSVWEQVVAIMTRTNTPVESAVNLVSYVWFTLMGVVLGWFLHKTGSRR